MIETVLKHQLGGISKSIEDRLVKSMAGQSERLVERVVVPKLLGKPGFVNACSKGVTDGVGPAVEGMFNDMFRNVFMPGMLKVAPGMFVQIHEALDKGFADSFKKNSKGASRDDSFLLKSLEEKVTNAGRASEHTMHVMFSQNAQEYGFV
jgi:hypothetical protein